MLRWNGAVYYMPWKGYQINVSLPVAPFAFQANIGDARIAGVESTVEIRPLDGLQVSVAGNYNDATLRSDAFQRPDFLVVPGERLPEAPELNWSAVVRYEHALLTLVRGYTQVDIAHKGGMWNDVRLDHRVWQPPYTLFNLRLGLAQADGHWQAEAYATNLANKRAVVFADQTGYASYQGHSQPVIPTAPRAYGIRLSYNWGK